MSAVVVGGGMFGCCRLKILPW